MDPGAFMVGRSRTKGRETGRPTRSRGTTGKRADPGWLGALGAMERERGSKKKVDRRPSQDDEG